VDGVGFLARDLDVGELGLDGADGVGDVIDQNILGFVGGSEMGF
jgi:hypothetical protein